MQQIQEAKKGNITSEAARIAELEKQSPEFISTEVAAGRIAILKNVNHQMRRLCGVGNGLRTKTNVNLGTSSDICDIENELQKVRIAKKYGADAVMDLSTGGDLPAIRARVLAEADMPLGTVPIYEAAVRTQTDGREISGMSVDEIFGVIELQAKEGVDFVTVHCGVTMESVERLRREGRVMNVVSRGGAFLIDWMLTNQKQNPLYERYDRLLEIAASYDLTLSLGDGMRPGCLADATDRAQIQELITLGELAQRALDANVQVMIEGPGHIPINEVKENIRLQKELCHGAPFYVLGPIVTDVAPGYDHITSAIGGAIAASVGADFLCYVTPAEHLRLPSLDDVREGLIAARIAAHAADIAKGVPGAADWDLEIARKREKRDWGAQINLAMDPDKAMEYHDSAKAVADDVCTMCSQYCSIKLSGEHLKSGKKKQTHHV
jgi:phosphomethylpyrimidine synthase